jgi:blue copper oxidase
MKKDFALILIFSLAFFYSEAQYNTLLIPDTLSGTQFNLDMKDTLKQLFPGQQTITAGINGDFWGPTLIFQQGDTVHMNVHNYLNDSTTLHWHGFHLPAVMDGGPHQVIPPNTIWQPYWKVTNNAGLYWYHPHLHMETLHQITQGLGGLIIVRDSIEGSLALPRKYGTDDFPLALTDRRFDASHQLVDAPYGDSMMVNGVLRAQLSVPSQVVRFRILDAALERSYNLGFSDNRTFYVITSDGGLLNAPVPVTRYFLSVGERIEILVDFSGQQGQTLDLKAYNSNLPPGMPGDEPINFAPPFGNALGAIDFNILHLVVSSPTSNPVTAIPSALTSNIPYAAASAQLTRVVTISDSLIPPGPGPTFIINHQLFDINHIEYTVPIDNIEIWQLTSTSTFSHPFHIHDVQFNILTRNGVAPPAAEQGWKDVVFVRGGETVRFIAKFSDFSDTIHPYMFHCHIAPHEDIGMMGQFVVGASAAGIPEELSSETDFNMYPNPANDKLYVKLNDLSNSVYYITVSNILGKVILMLPQPQVQNGIDISRLSSGSYFLTLTETKSKSRITKKFIKE